jgi:hypothetical protein
MCGPHHCLGRDAFASGPEILRRLLQLRQNASILEQGCAGFSPNSANRKHQITRHPWRTSPPLRPNLSFRYTQLNSPTYVEQTALTTGVNELFTRDEMRRNNYPQKMEDVRNAFVRYLLKIDAGRVTIPTSKVYDQIGLARRQIERMIPPKRSRAPVKWGSQSPPSM